jgi:glutamate-1-semialdehyde 2,1-aminomutase
MKKKTLELLKYIPGGAHTYSRGYDQFPVNAPEILLRGKGAYVYDSKGKKYLDYSMGLRAVNIGYNEKDISNAAIQQIKNGNNLSRPSIIELKAAKKLVNLISSIDMVKFSKNGSSSVTAAVKLARAYTKKKIILRCYSHPFFSYDDWFIGSTSVKRGIPKEIQKMTKSFRYNDINQFKKIIKENKGNIACVVLEPATTECPNLYLKNNKVLEGCCGKKKCDRDYKNNNHFLKEVETACKKEKIIFILDEMITGFRWSLKGAQNFFGLDPDITTFGKAMSNGFSLSAVCGKKAIMQLGSIEFKGRERVFLLSSTYGGEMSSLAAFCETLNFLKKKNVINKIWDYGYRFKNIFNDISKELDIIDYVYCEGPSCAPYYYCKDKNLKNSLEFKTLFMQQMINNKIIIPSGWLAFSYRHGNKELEMTKKALYRTLKIYKEALFKGYKSYLTGDSIKPVFRKYN